MVSFKTFLVLAINGREWSVSFSGRFTSVEKVIGIESVEGYF